MPGGTTRRALGTIAIRFALLFFVCVRLAHATDFGEVWEQVTLGSPLPSSSYFAVADDGIWAAGYLNGLYHSSNGVDWEELPTLPEEAREPVGLFWQANILSYVATNRFYYTQNPRSSWQSSEMLHSPYDTNSGAIVLRHKGMYFTVGGSSTGDSSEDWSCADETSEWTLETGAAPYSIRTHFSPVSFNERLWALPGDPYLGGTANDIWSSEDGSDWTLELENAPWAPRRFYASAVFHERLYIIGGQVDFKRRSDVWSTEDGRTWREEPPNDPYFALAVSQSVGSKCPQTFVWKDQLYLMGGISLATWRTSDGTTWEHVPNRVPWAERAGFGTARFHGELYMFGGEDTLGVHSSVWKSKDGKTWSKVTDAAPWPERRGMNVVLKDDCIWLLGGASRSTEYNDVWRSCDGVHWEEISANASWTPRYFAGAAVHDGYIWVDGGLHAGISALSDIWRSRDGLAWERMEDAAPWGPLFGMGMASHRGELWIVGGGKFIFGDDDVPLEEYGVRDVWHSSDGVVWDRVENAVSARSHPALRAYDGRLWVSGGFSRSVRGDQFFQSDVLSSEDGITWTPMNAETSWPERMGHGMEFLGGNVYLWGGTNGRAKFMHDVWRSAGDIQLHSSDTNRDAAIDLDELLRCIQFYNSFGLHCAVDGEASEDGYIAGPGDAHTCEPHASDYAPQDWSISLDELLRLIQFYNTLDGYHPCNEGEDGFCIGTAP